MSVSPQITKLHKGLRSANRSRPTSGSEDTGGGRTRCRLQDVRRCFRLVNEIREMGEPGDFGGPT